MSTIPGCGAQRHNCDIDSAEAGPGSRITSYNVCYTKLLRSRVGWVQTTLPALQAARAPARRPFRRDAVVIDVVGGAGLGVAQVVLQVLERPVRRVVAGTGMAQPISYNFV